LASNARGIAVTALIPIIMDPFSKYKDKTLHAEIEIRPRKIGNRQAMREALTN
jgi:hypothetical protein